ncbi:MAG: hypothetical protein JXA14_13670 [Anaerolineae bacterium]|nr:hypothetical protein [Anaerolineae bacterium]
MRILSVRVGFAADHSTVAYRYTAPDKATAWHAFWEGLPAVCAAGQVQDLALFSPEPLPELDLRPRPIHRFLFVEEAGDSPGTEPPYTFGGYLTFDEWRDLVAQHHRQLLYAFLAPGYGAEGVISLSPHHLLVNDYFEYGADGFATLQRLDPQQLAFFRDYDHYDDGMWELVLWEPAPGTYTIEPGVERRQSRRWHIAEFKGLVDAELARRELTPWMAHIVRVECRGLFIWGPPQNGGLAFNATTGRSHIFFNFESSTDERVIDGTLQAMGHAGRCRFFYQPGSF